MAKGLVYGGLNSVGSNIKSIQRGETSVNATSVNVPINNIDLTKSVVLIGNVAGNYTISEMSIEAKLTSSNTLNLSKYASNYDITVYWVVIEFNNVKSLQSGEITNSLSTAFTQSISPVDPNKSLVFYSVKINSDGNIAYVAYTYCRLIDSTTIGLRHMAASAKTYSWFVVEFN